MEHELFSFLSSDYSSEVGDLVTAVDLLTVEDVNKVSSDTEHPSLFEIIARQLDN
jgi:hypothetical protein